MKEELEKPKSKRLLRVLICKRIPKNFMIRKKLGIIDSSKDPRIMIRRDHEMKSMSVDCDGVTKPIERLQRTMIPPEKPIEVWPPSPIV